MLSALPVASKKVVTDEGIDEEHEAILRATEEKTRQLLQRTLYTPPYGLFEQQRDPSSGH